MCVMNEFLENRKPSLWAHEAETRKATGKMLFSEGPGKWGFDAFTLREGVVQEKTSRYGEKGPQKQTRCGEQQRTTRILTLTEDPAGVGYQGVGIRKTTANGKTGGHWLSRAWLCGF